jgi:hypothetical protein
MLLATASQMIFVIAYSFTATSGPLLALISATISFGFATLIFSQFDLNPFEALLIVLLFLTIGLKLLSGKVQEVRNGNIYRPKWDLVARMLVATVVVFLITESAPIVGAHTAGLISPFPILAAILAIFAHIQQGKEQALISLYGLAIGLFTPTMFFFILSSLLTEIGYLSFLYATLAAVIIQIISGKFLTRN